MSTNRLLALCTVGALALGATACSSSDSAKPANKPTTTASSNIGSGNTNSTKKQERPAGPAAKVDKELTGGKPFLGASRNVDLAAAGYEEHEYQVSGTATAYQGEQPADGNWSLKATNENGDFTTRIVIRRPKDPAKASGTVLLEWLNVSGGIDANPDFAYMSDEILRQGHTWVGVSAQYIGVDGGPTAVALPGIDNLTGKGLVKLDPARYGDLSHPGDQFAYDLYTQVSRALRANSAELLGGIKIKNVLATGESQSGFALTTYANGIQPLTQEFDGFFIHSRGGPALPLAPAPDTKSLDITAAITGLPMTIREDLGVPVFMLESESDVLGVLGFVAARQPDTKSIVSWEMAGTAHVDLYMLGAVAELAGCQPAVNNGPHNIIAKAGLRALVTWVDDGTVPPASPQLEVAESKYVRDANGIAKGGIRTPLVDVPVDVLSGEPAANPSIFCMLAGTTTPLPNDVIAKLYSSPQDYLDKYEKAADAAIKAGFVLEDDRQELLDMASPTRVG